MDVVLICLSQNGNTQSALPPLDDQRAFVFATSGGAPGRVLYDLTSLLRSKGADVLGGFLARGQVHHPAPHMIGQSPGHPDAKDLTRARRFAVAVAKHVSAGRSGPLPERRPDALKPGWGFYELVGLISSDTLLRLMTPEPKPDPLKCDQCRWCVYECPMDNITLRQPFDKTQDRAQCRLLQSHTVLGDQCIRCYRCLTGCPQKAFDANWRLADPFLLFLHNATFMLWFGDLEPGEKI